ncbi:EcoKI restriction-modification system protein HsdS [Bacteroidales bacterium Barb4]|nr:EcoKI restriction-modification system protein HsdS [Bacteroidales bacterium Barb4]
MNIPQGYKNSPLGVIPQEWDVKKLGEISKITSGGTPLREKKEYWNGNIPWVTTTLLNNPVIEKVEEYITEDGLQNSATKLLPKGTLLMAMYGQGQTRGKVSKLMIEAATNQACASLSINNKNFTNYIFYQLDKNYEVIRNLSNDGNQKNLSLELIKGIQIVLPPLPEQQKIAEILTVWDKAIDIQTQYIASLENRKRGLMQQLLTGKKRLKGFSEKWKDVKLEEVGYFLSGCGFTEVEQGGVDGVPFYKVSDMNLLGNESCMRSANNYVNEKQIKRCGYKVIEQTSILFAKVGAAIFLERKRLATHFLMDNNMMAFMPKYGNILFIKYVFDKIRLSKYIQIGALPSYNASDLSSIKISLPSIEEQTAIANILSTADQEIAFTKKKLASLKEQKKGLMQQLLTGKRRMFSNI